MEMSKIFFGSNPYSSAPVIIYKINIDKRTYFNAKKACLQIINHFPECFSDMNLSNLEPKIYIGTVLSEFSKYLINDNNGYVKSSGVTINDGLILIWVEFHYPQLTNKAIKLVLEIFQLLMRGDVLSDRYIKNLLNSFNKFCYKFHAESTPFFEISKDDDIPMMPYGRNGYWQFGWGKLSIIFMKSSSMEDSYYGVKDSMNKEISIDILRGIGLSTAKSIVIDKIIELENAVKSIGYPCVIKPIRGTHGEGITSNIKNYNELKIAYKHAKKSYYGHNPILVEAFIQGDDYRIMVANGQFLGAVKRRPSYVIGNGKLTLKELIYNLNEVRADFKLNPNHLKLIPIDDFLVTHLNRQRISLDDVIEKDKVITLSSIANYSSGGIVEDVTDLVHPQIKHMSELIAQSSGIATLGVDYITTDISKPYYEVDGAITEYNHLPSSGLVSFLANPKDSLRKILNIGSGRIPVVVAIIDSSRITQAQNWCKKNIQDKTVGWACVDDVYIGQLPLQVTDTSGWEIAKILLRNKTVEKALFICSDEEIMIKGLPVDKAEYIFINDINLTYEWDKVINKSAKKVKMFSDIESLLSFALKD